MCIRDRLLYLCWDEVSNQTAKSRMCQPPILVSLTSFRWIVVAAHRKNIKGRFLEHGGYWAPRHGVNVDRQITLNMPRIKYWMGNGAVPTPRVQKCLSHWDVLPKPFYVESRYVTMQVKRFKNLKKKWAITRKENSRGREREGRGRSWIMSTIIDKWLNTRHFKLNTISDIRFRSDKKYKQLKDRIRY